MREHALTQEAAPSRAAWTRLVSWDSLRSHGSGWWIDRAMPRAPGPFLAAALLVPVAWFAIGLALTDDRAAYVATPDVKYQLWFLALHLITMRVMSSLWRRGLAPALDGLGIAAGERRRVEAAALGRWANAGALAAAAYFIARDTYMAIHPGPSGLNAFDDPDMWNFGALGHGVRTMMLVAWHLEWVIFGYLLWLQLSTMVTLGRAMRRTDFEPRLGRLLVHDEYRAFFTLLSKTATLSMVFALGNLLFVYLTGELFPRDVVTIDGAGDFLKQMSDVLSISALFVVIVAGMFVHLISLRRALTRAVNARFGAAGDAALELLAEPLELSGDPAADVDRLRAYVEAHNAIARAGMFQREIDQLGGRAMKTVIAKAVPVLTAAAKRIAKMHVGAP